MFAQIVFPERRPAALGKFDYRIPQSLIKKIEIGQLVSAPFRSQVKIGVIISINKTSKIPASRLRNVKEIVENVPILTHKQIDLALWVAQESNSSIATTINSFIPAKPNKKIYQLAKNALEKNTHRTYTEKLYIHNLYTNMFEEIKKEFNNNGQSCIIVPDTLYFVVVKKIIPSALEFSGTMKPVDKFSVWERVHNEKKITIVGTRNALYLPFKNLKKIILVKEEDINYQRQDQHPDYDTRAIAKKCAELHRTPISFHSFAPTVNTYHRLQKNISLPSKSIAKIKIIDKKLFALKKQSSILPEDLLDYIKNNDGAHIIIYNKKGRFRYIECPDCSWVPTCKTCGSGFIHEHSSSGQIRCGVCKTEQRLPETCENCNSTQIRTLSPGIEILSQKIDTAIPNKQIARISKDDPHIKQIKKSDVIIGTDFMLPHIPWETVASLTVLDIDTALNYPDFRANEWTFQRLRFLSARLPITSRLFILTSSPHHEVFSQLLSKSLSVFYSRELKTRKELNYPPFSNLLTLSNLFDSPKKRNDQLSKVIKTLNIALNEKNIPVSILELQPVPEKTLKGYKALILIRADSKYINPIFTLLNTHFTDWKSKRNPLDLYS